ncbi:MAG: hydroxyacid dehydrogenase [Deltaproteobacteria bacterium]|nr:MAG: hydroxyacid dehydrogenase [Deltaproteobacteria bacterium]
MRILFADKLPDHARVRLATGGNEVRAEPGLKGEPLVEALRDFDPQVLVVRSTRVTRAHLAAPESLALIVRAGAGVNTIDIAAASAQGIFVANCPGKNAVAVAELTFGLILAIDRHLPEGVIDLRAGRWNKAKYGKAQGLRGRTLGILGTGQIGSEVARLGQSFGMEVLAWSRSLTDAQAAALGVRRYDSPEDVALRSNVLSVHLALTPETAGFVGESILSVMKPNATFINTCRAEVIDEAALLRALESPGIRAGLDVFSGEPASSSGAFEHPLASHPRVVGSHHIGASTAQAQIAVADEACAVIEAFQTTGRPTHCVNLTKPARSDHQLIVRHLDRVGVLAAVLDRLSADGVSVGEMENQIFDGEEAAVARLRLRGRPSDQTLSALRGHEHVLSLACLPSPRNPE